LIYYYFEKKGDSYENYDPYRRPLIYTTLRYTTLQYSTVLKYSTVYTTVYTTLHIYLHRNTNITFHRGDDLYRTFIDTSGLQRNL